MDKIMLNEKIELNELPKYSPWVDKLLNITPFQKQKRSIFKIDAEYDKDKYAKLLQFYDQNPDIDINKLRNIEKQCISSKGKICISKKNELFLVSTSVAEELAKQTIIDNIVPYMTKDQVIIELGCGYGYNLSVLRNVAPDHLFLGGDYSQNAVSLACKLFKNHQEVKISQFNFYDETWPIFDAVEGKALVFTNHAIEQLPSTKSVLSTLTKYKKKIACVVHLEPIFEFNDTNSTLSLMRRSYTLVNDYNTDLFTCIKERGVKILTIKKDVFGSNPLNPTSLIIWQF